MLFVLLIGAAEIATSSTSTTPADALRREDELFGADPIEGVDLDERVEDAAEGGRDKEEAVFGSEAEPKDGVFDRLEAALDQTEDFLDLGGSLWLQLEYRALEEGSPKSFALASPSFLNMFADVRPVERLRGFVQARLRYDFTIAPDAVDPFTGEARRKLEVLLDQYWVKLDILETVFVTAGKEPVRWGISRIWQPSDFLNPLRRDPIALFDQRLGIAIVKVHLPIESLGWNFYAIANLEEADELQKIGGAFRAELVFWTAELTVSASFRKDSPVRLGADLSFGAWLFDFRAEVGIAHRVRTPFYRGDPSFDDGVTIEDLQAVEKYDRRDAWIPQVVAGVEIAIPYTEQDNLIVAAEYFFNDFGVSNPELYPFMAIDRQFVPFYVGRHYAALILLLFGPGSWDDTSFTLYGIGNLSDRSFLARLQYTVSFFNYLTVNAYGNVHFGEKGELRLGVDIPPGGSIPGLENGFEIVAPLVEVGVALTVDL